MNILDKILKDKRIEVSTREKTKPVLKPSVNKSIKDNKFVKALEKEGISVISEIKRKSPSAGLIRKDFNHIEIAKTYERAGASAISVLTDEKYFGGNLDFIPDIKKETNIPVLRKEFIISEYQIYESFYMKADAILLIVKALTFEELENFVSLANSLEIATLVEVHSKDELEKALETETKIIGINNRNLDTMKVDINTSLKLAKMIPDKFVKVSESGIKTHDDIKKLRDSGFDAFLIGESLMRENNIEKKLKSLLGEDNE